MDKNHDAKSLDDEPTSVNDQSTPDDESTLPPASRMKYRHLMIAGIIVIVLAVTAVVFIAVMID